MKEFFFKNQKKYSINKQTGTQFCSIIKRNVDNFDF